MHIAPVFDAPTASAEFVFSSSITSEDPALLDSNPSEAATEQTPVVYRRDPYTISEDGHIVGHDGFIVPKDFAEFYERFPQFVRKFVRRRWTRASEAEIEDRESELLLFLMDLPSDSKYREPGFNGRPEGCTDRIQIFHPDNAYGASAPRFNSYINLCLMNHFCSLSKKASSNPIRRYNTLSMYSPDAEGELVDEDYIYNLSLDYSSGCNYDRRIEDCMLVNEFITYVELHNPELVSVIEAIAQTETFVEAQKALGMTEKLFLRARNRLQVLHKWFSMGEEPPRQRKVYTSREPVAVSRAAALKVEAVKPEVVTVRVEAVKPEVVTVRVEAVEEIATIQTVEVEEPVEVVALREPLSLDRAAQSMVNFRIKHHSRPGRFNHLARVMAARGAS